MLTSVCRALSVSSAFGAGPGRVGNAAATFSQGFLSVCREGGKGQEARPQDVSGPLFLSVGPGEPGGRRLCTGSQAQGGWDCGYTLNPGSDFRHASGSRILGVEGILGLLAAAQQQPQTFVSKTVNICGLVAHGIPKTLSYVGLAVSP